VLVPPAQRGGSSSLGRSHGAALILTATPSGTGLGLRLDARNHGIRVGYGDDDFGVEGAEEAGSRVAIARSAESDGGEWVARGIGRVHHNGAAFNECCLSTGDAIRVENTFFRFLCGADIEGQYCETVYHLTIVDFATELHNTRYLLEALDKELRRAIDTASVVVVATIQFERDANSTLASHDVLGNVASVLRRHLSQEQVIARSGDLEIAVVSPDSSAQDVEVALQASVRPLSGRTAPMHLGLAASHAGIDASTLLARSRANARPWSG
jgi:two-component system cell cycle response regulator